VEDFEVAIVVLLVAVVVVAVVVVSAVVGDDVAAAVGPPLDSLVDSVSVSAVSFFPIENEQPLDCEPGNGVDLYPRDDALPTRVTLILPLLSYSKLHWHHPPRSDWCFEEADEK